MATKRQPLSLGKNHVSLQNLSSEFKKTQTHLQDLFPELSSKSTDFKSQSGALSTLLSHYKVLASKLEELNSWVYRDSLGDSFMKLQREYSELLKNYNEAKSTIEKLSHENNYYLKQLSLLKDSAVQSPHLKSAQLQEAQEFQKRQSAPGKIEEVPRYLETQAKALESALSSPRASKSQLQKALEDSLKREEALKQQCDQLLETLKSAMSEDEKYAEIMSNMENKELGYQQTIAHLNEELSKFRKTPYLSDHESARLKGLYEEGSLQRFQEEWAQKAYKSLKRSDNSEMLRKVVELKDKEIRNLKHPSSREQELLNQLKQKDSEIEVLKNTLLGNGSQTQVELQKELKEKESDIKELLLEYQRLQESYDFIKEQKQVTDKEVSSLRMQLANKHSELSNYYGSSKFKESTETQADYDENLASQLTQARTNLDFYQNQVKLLKSYKADLTYDLRETIKQLAPKEKHFLQIQTKFEELLQSKVAEGLQDIQRALETILQTKVEQAHRKAVNSELQERRTKYELNKLKQEAQDQHWLNSELRKREKTPESVEMWKKLGKDYAARVERNYEKELQGLKNLLQDYEAKLTEKDTQLASFEERYSYDTRELKNKLKREHEAKKQIAEFCAKEKKLFEETKNKLQQSWAQEEDRTQEKHNYFKQALEESQTNIYQLQQEINRLHSEVKDALNQKQETEDLLEEAQSTKQELYSEITRLHKQLEEYRSETYEELKSAQQESSQIQSEYQRLASEVQEKEQEVNSLLEDRNKLRDQILKQDYSMKALELELEKLQKFKEERNVLSELQSENNHLQRTNQDLEQKVFYLEKENKNMHTKVSELNDQLCEVSFQLKETRQDLNNSRKSYSSEVKSLQESMYAEESSKLQKLQRRVNEISKKYECIKNDLENVKSQKQQYEVENDYLKKQLEEAQQNSTYFKCHFEELKESTKQELTQKNSTIKSLKQRVSELELEDQTTLIKKIQEKLQAFESKYEELESSQQEMVECFREAYSEWVDLTPFISSQRLSVKKGISKEAVSEATSYFKALFQEAKELACPDLGESQIGAASQSDYSSFMHAPSEFQEAVSRINNLLDQVTPEENPDSQELLSLAKENLELHREVLNLKEQGRKPLIPSHVKSAKDINKQLIAKLKEAEEETTELRKQIVKLKEAVVKSRQKRTNEHALREQLNKAVHQITNLQDAVNYLQSQKQEESLKKELEKAKTQRDELYETISKINSEQKASQEITENFKNEAETWKSSMKKILETLESSSKHRVTDSNNPQAVSKTIVDFIEYYKDLNPQFWQSREQEYTSRIEQLVLEKQKLVENLDAYENENFRLRKNLDYYRSASDNQEEELHQLKIRTQKINEEVLKNEQQAKENYELGHKEGFEEGQRREREVLEAENKRLQEILQEYREAKEDLHTKFQELHDKLNQEKTWEDKDLVEGMMEEKRVREALEQELTAKCDLIENLLKELQTKRNYIQR